MRYEINKPESELTEGYFTLIIKYTTLFILGWLGAWILLLIISTRRGTRNSGIGDVFFGNPEYTSIVIAIAVIYFFGQKAYKNYKLGLITSIEFEETKLKLGLLNTINGSHKTKEINTSNLKIKMQTKQDSLYGNQRIFEFFENNILINRLNIELTAWNRHTEIELIVTKLIEIKSKSN